MTEKHLPHDHGTQAALLLSDMPNTDSFETSAELMKLLSDSTRLRIFWLLCHCEECVINLSAMLDMSSPAVSHHLKLLKTAGLVTNRREGKEVYYTAARTSHCHVLHDMIQRLMEVACPGRDCFDEHHSYESQAGSIGDIHDLLTQDLRQRHTIESLSVRFHMNPTTLKALFKRAYGKPVAAYMKEYRIKYAAQLLKQTDLPISRIAADVGYGNQSKFTQAFKDITGLLPKDYRKANSHKA